ncbi:MAG: hypothetical protein DRQ10_01955 [Candidatus Hydrothermota bacterium]|nr:MAG: hypothetical protein DRQ10_01955 [Candidatus Hydrothermae bacterium]
MNGIAIFVLISNIFTFSSARELALNGGLGAFSFNSDAEFVNPANFATTSNVNWNLISLTLPQGMGLSGNSSFSHKEVFEYFMDDRYLDDNTKRTILQRVSGGLSTSVDGDVSPLINFGCPNFGISLNILNSARVKLPYQLIDLALNGNELGREYRFDENGLKLEGHLAIMLSMSYGNRFELLDFPFDVGIGIRLVRGVKAVKLTKGHGYLITDSTSISSSGVLEIAEGEGDISTAFDFGLALEPLENLRLGLAILNLNGTMHWNKNVKLHHIEGDAQNIALKLLLYSMELEDLSDLVSDTAWDSEGQPFTTELPRIFRFSVGYDLEEFVRFPLRTGMDFIKIMNETPFSDKMTKLVFAAEGKPLRWLPYLRLGLAFGDEYGTSISYGFGWRLKFVQIDFAAQHYKGLFWGSRGGRMALDIGVIF